MTLPVSDPTAWATAMNNLGMAPLGIAGQPILPDFDPALGMMTGIPPITPMMPGLGIVPPPIPPDMPVVKEIIHCKSCTLFPPNPNLPPPATRERPPGCKTVFVGGLPENGTEQIIVEVFEQCGEIIAIRKSKKNFCHIRFAEEYMVDKALYLSDCIPSAMTHSVNLRKTKPKPEEACKAFEDISKYFSKEEWAKLSHSEKITYVYMKRNYTTMTNLGLRAHLPDFMESNEQATKSVLSDSDEVFSHESQGKRRPVSIWSHRLRERKKQVIYEEISDPEDEKEEREEEHHGVKKNIIDLKIMGTTLKS
ncbi:uncharacterized protein LOC116888929 [Rattus rattus]|uniref:uncharacterized protein LOC116888929 n=1 Tax=Rattus rattus TaxID=10117 RepID=UPI0013F3738B|nr:uncharacterized protein LOC116888929 [Rattus rattus]